MKSEGAVRQKLKQVRFRHAKRVLENSLAVAPHNCAHNAFVEVPGVGDVGFCTLPSTSPVLCDATRGCDLSASCGKYAPLHTKDTVKGQVEADLDAPIPEVAAKYPDAAALMWVLTDEPPVPDALPLMDPFGESGVLVGTFFGVPLWVGSEGARVMVGQALHALVEGEAHLRREVGLKAEALQVMQEELDTLQTEVQVVRERFLQTEKDLALVTDDLKGRVQELEDALRRVTEERDTLQAKFDLPLWSPSRWSK